MSKENKILAIIPVFTIILLGGLIAATQTINNKNQNDSAQVVKAAGIPPANQDNNNPTEKSPVKNENAPKEQMSAEITPEEPAAQNIPAPAITPAAANPPISASNPINTNQSISTPPPQAKTHFSITGARTGDDGDGIGGAGIGNDD
ncbi:MAG: hypothetical protein NTW60_01730 [Candidatus Wolfebacteria bacterium]|nr:hypothetical protein [Candidatus Wolfebacteria bacterium]